MSAKDFRKTSHPELELSLYLSNFSKKISQLIDWDTYKKFMIIRNWCTNILGMSPEDFRKISHPEPKILNSLVNWSHTHRQTDRRTSVNLELTPPEVGQLKTNQAEFRSTGIDFEFKSTEDFLSTQHYNQLQIFVSSGLSPAK